MYKNESIHLEQIVAILPLHVPKLTPSELVRTIEVLTHRGLGSDNLYNNYLYLQVERKIYQINGNDYCKLLRCLVHRQFFEDARGDVTRLLCRLRFLFADFEVTWEVFFECDALLLPL